MKSAREWQNQFGIDYLDCTSVLNTEQIKQIQSDARRAGVIEGLKMASDLSLKYKKTENARFAIDGRILELEKGAKQWTEKDL